MSVKISYFGGKAGDGVFQNIINEIPKCKIFVDAFVGGGGIVRNLSMPDLTIVNDIDPKILLSDYATLGENIKVYNTDYKNVVSLFDSADTVIYFDPPYNFETRKSHKHYYYKEWTNKEHLDFLEFVQSLKSKVIISHYPFQLYDRILINWRTKVFKAMTRQGQVLEKIYMNYEKPLCLQDYRYLGENFTDRQRIKRQTSNIIRKINSLPAQQRNHIISILQYS